MLQYRPDDSPAIMLQSIHIFVMVKSPEPVQFPVPVKTHLPLMVPPFTVPVSVNTFPLGVPDLMVIPNVPFTLPPKFPVRPNVPVAVSPETKHEEFDEKENVVTFTVPSPL